MDDAFFVPDGDDTFVSTAWTRGPWSLDAQHAGPPAALLGRAIERVDGGDAARVARIVFDILRPVPIEPLTVSARTVRPGRNVELIEAWLNAGDDEVMRASAWRIRTAPIATDTVETDEPLEVPSHSSSTDTFDIRAEQHYIAAMEWRFTEGSFLQAGPAVAWLRMRIPLVAGEEPGPLVRVLAAVDSASGISTQLDHSKWLFINPDLAVYLHRVPTGEWVRLDARTRLGDDGIGVATSQIFDVRGPLGYSSQSLMIRQR
ncbi:MAG: thioesterase family protein [Actinomycetota bacterium]